jgi:hypothetical protein
MLYIIYEVKVKVFFIVNCWARMVQLKAEREYMKLNIRIALLILLIRTTSCMLIGTLLTTA